MVVQLYFLIAIETIYKQHQKKRKKKKETNKKKPALNTFHIHFSGSPGQAGGQGPAVRRRRRKSGHRWEAGG